MTGKPGSAPRFPSRPPVLRTLSSPRAAQALDSGEFVAGLLYRPVHRGWRLPATAASNSFGPAAVRYDADGIPPTQLDVSLNRRSVSHRFVSLEISFPRFPKQTSGKSYVGTAANQ